MVSAVVRRRGRGESAGIDLEQILTVAKSMPRSSLTMQSVANALGVDRKALYNYVPDRDGLLTLVALDAFAAQFATLDIARTSSWQGACTAFAQAFGRGIVAAEDLSDHLWFSEALTSWFLEPTELLFDKLAQAGFDDDLSIRAVTLLTTIALGHARDVTQATAGAGRPGRRSLLRALAPRDPDRYPNLTRIAQNGENTYESEQLRFALEVFAHGVAAELDARSGTREDGRNP